MLSVLAWDKFHRSLNLSQAEQGPQITQECVQNVTVLASPFPGVNPHVSTKSTTQISTDSGATNTHIEETLNYHQMPDITIDLINCTNELPSNLGKLIFACYFRKRQKH
jgi:hypothetical protein